VAVEVEEPAGVGRALSGGHPSITSATVYQFRRYIPDKSVARMVVTDRKMVKLVITDR